MKRYKFIDSWSYYDEYCNTGRKERVIGIFEAETLEEAILKAEKEDKHKEVNSRNKAIKIKENTWSMTGCGCPHWITIEEI